MDGKSSYSQNIFLDKILEFIRLNRDKPFFLYHPTQLPHGPVAVPEVHSDFVNDSRMTQIEKEYASMVKMLDYEISVEKDGMSFLPELIGRKSKQHDYVVYSSFMGPAIITNDGWKLRYFASEDIFQLYYLPGDYREENNLIGKHQERADQLKKILIDECNGDLYNGWYRSNSSFILPSIKNETLH